MGEPIDGKEQKVITKEEHKEQVLPGDSNFLGIVNYLMGYNSVIV